MIDIRLLRHDPAHVLAKLARKSAERVGRELLEVDASWKSLTATFEELRAQQKQQSRKPSESELPMLARQKEELQALQANLTELERRRKELLDLVPNPPDDDVPDGDGRIVTWAERLAAGGTSRLRLRRHGIDGRRWDRAERLVMEGGAQRALVDAYRTLHGYNREDFSWFLTRGSRRVGRRFDHVFCSPDLRPLSCEYLHEVRERGLSDHSALQLSLTFERVPRPTWDNLCDSSGPSPRFPSESAKSATAQR